MLKLLLTAILVLICTACGSIHIPQPKPEATLPHAVTQEPAQPELSGQLQRSLEQFNGQTGLYGKNLQTGQVFIFNQDSIFPTASTHKLVVALAIYKYVYQDSSIADKQRFDTSIKDMIVASDNPAFYDLLADIEHKQPDALTRVLSDLKLVHTRIHSREAFAEYGYHSVTTPYEMATVLEAIYNKTYLGKEFSAILKEELANTIYQDEIPRLLPNAKVLHKVGELPGVQCDVGIIDDGHAQILLSVYTTTHLPPPYASDFIAATSAQTYNLLRSK